MRDENKPAVQDISSVYRAAKGSIGEALPLALSSLELERRRTLNVFPL